MVGNSQIAKEKKIYINPKEILKSETINMSWDGCAGADLSFDDLGQSRQGRILKLSKSVIGHVPCPAYV